MYSKEANLTFYKSQSENSLEKSILELE